MQKIREIYIEILAEIADSTMLEDILTEVSGKPVSLMKYSSTLGNKIRQSEYALS